MQEFRSRDDVPLIATAEEAANNIMELNSWLTDHPRRFNASLRSVRRWYAIWDERAGLWCVGFSKFVGYRGMTGERYLRYRTSPKGVREPLSGQVTENKRKPLWKQSTAVEKDTPLHDEILADLVKFLRSQNLDSPGKRYSIRILNGFEKPL